MVLFYSDFQKKVSASIVCSIQGWARSRRSRHSITDYCDFPWLIHAFRYYYLFNYTHPPIYSTKFHPMKILCSYACLEMPPTTYLTPSNWWYYFDRIGKATAKCKVEDCSYSKTLNASHSTTVLSHHLKQHHPQLYKQREQSLGAEKSKKDELVKKSKGSKGSFFAVFLHRIDPEFWFRIFLHHKPL